MKRSNRFEVSVFAEKVESLLISLQIPYQNPATYCLAFYHRSALNEFALGESNERVEYLGDAVLELIVTDYLYHLYPEAQEGKLTDIRSALVRGRNLADIALHIGLSEFVMLSRGETQAGGATNPYILANAFEALLGCTYLDAGFEAAKWLVDRLVISTLDAILAGSLHVDPKSHLQEIIQARDMVTPTYELLSEAWADHDKEYKIGVYYATKLIGSGNGSSKKKAQTAAAEDALARRTEWDTPAR